MKKAHYQIKTINHPGTKVTNLSSGGREAVVTSQEKLAGKGQKVIKVPKVGSD